MNHAYLVAIPLLLLGIFNSAGKIVVITKAQDQSKIKVAKNSEFQVLLDANPTTGYSWQIVSYDSAVIKKKTEKYLPSHEDRKIVGSGGQQLFKFKTLAVGTTELQMIYQRSWERAAEDATHFRVQIIVAK